MNMNSFAAALTMLYLYNIDNIDNIDNEYTITTEAKYFNHYFSKIETKLFPINTNKNDNKIIKAKTTMIRYIFNILIYRKNKQE